MDWIDDKTFQSGCWFEAFNMPGWAFWPGTAAEAQSDERGREMATKETIVVLITGTSVQNWRMDKTAIPTESGHEA